MLRDLRLASYSPTVAVRPAEMRGIEELAEKDKATIFPMVLLAPWVGSATLDKSIERLRKAYGDRPVFIDIDRDFRSSNPSNEAHRQFFQLQQGDVQFQRWREFIGAHDGLIPVVQHRGQSANDLLVQLEWAEGLGRGFGFRFDDPTEGIPALLGPVLQQIEHAEFGFFLDGRWSPTAIEHELWFRNSVTTLNGFHQGVPIVLSSSNFPAEFSNIEGVQTRTIGSRTVFNAVRQATNQPLLVYGDWGSTKPRKYERSGTPLPRIDYATRNNWAIARNKAEQWTYADAASHMMQSQHWRSGLSVWGANMIERTALNDPFAIDSSSKNVAARVNLHLHVQANYASGDAVVDTDDPWED